LATAPLMFKALHEWLNRIGCPTRSMITRGKRRFLCLGCNKPIEIDTIRYGHPEAPEMLCTGPGFLGITPSDGDDPRYTSVSIVCSEACCVTFLERGAAELGGSGEDTGPATLPS